jgi:hypothetical protein
MVPQQSGLVLSGGLGSSEYVQSRFTTCYDPRGIPILVDKAPEEPYVPSFTFVRQCSTYKFAAHSPSAKALSLTECSVSSTVLQSFESVAVAPLMAFYAMRFTVKLSTKDENLTRALSTVENMLLDIFDGLSRKARALKKMNLSSSSRGVQPPLEIRTDLGKVLLSHLNCRPTLCHNTWVKAILESFARSHQI